MAKRPVATSRRNVLKKSATVGAIGTLAGLTAATDEAAALSDDLGDPVWTKNFHDIRTETEPFGLHGDHQYRLEFSEAVEYYGGEEHRGSYYHRYRVAGTTVSRFNSATKDEWEKAGFDNQIVDHNVHVDVNESELSLWDSTDRKYLGAYPNPGENADPDYEAAIEGVIGAALGKIHPYAGLAWTALGVYNALTNTTPAPDIQRNQANVGWDYDVGDSVHDAFHFFEFAVEDSKVCERDYFELEATASTNRDTITFTRDIPVPRVVDRRLC